MISFRSKISISVGFLILALLVGCATARTVSMQPGKGGVVAVHPAQDPEARAKAEEIMRNTCHGKKFEIVEEGETVIGTRSSTSGSTSVGYSSLYSNAATDTENKTEWRITYKCN